MKELFQGEESHSLVMQHESLDHDVDYDLKPGSLPTREERLRMSKSFGDVFFKIKEDGPAVGE